MLALLVPAVVNPESCTSGLRQDLVENTPAEQFTDRIARPRGLAVPPAPDVLTRLLETDGVVFVAGGHVHSLPAGGRMTAGQRLQETDMRMGTGLTRPVTIRRGGGDPGSEPGPEDW